MQKVATAHSFGVTSLAETCHPIFNYLALCAEQPHKKV
ncbi:hypothetical protein PL111_1543 [Leuconostoc inhae]|uniref:Uncharacterized protein n=1 Tax=Leuconostoc inhae TaxID=178001 RepID=A0AAN2UFJ9_9LACO|nr:hypothetical protein LEGAS_0837 [Leuconostoc gasicomitatum LMG 18811]CUW06569.1 hypothetical protein C120C_0106 [Leuconostoc inhae]CUW10033.1 hypothetical protein PL111_1543 [Leuconostoc inhae]